MKQLKMGLVLCAMILLIRSSLKAQDTYKYCFSRDTLEILARSNLERLEYIEKYDTALVEIKNLKAHVNYLNCLDSISIEIESNLENALDNRDEIIKSKDKKIKKQTKIIKIGKTVIGILIIITIVAWL